MSRTTAGPVASGTLSEAGRRKLRLWRAIVKMSLALTWICLTLELGLFLWPGAPRAARVVVGAVLIESFLAAVVLGAFGMCPACGQLFGIDSGRLMPERCRGCGVGLGLEETRIERRGARRGAGTSREQGAGSREQIRK